MNRRISPLVFCQLLLCMTLLLAACASGNSTVQPAPEADVATTANTADESQTDEESDTADIDVTPTEEPAEEPDTNETIDPTATPEEADASAESDTVASVSLIDLTNIDQVESVQTYRTRVTMNVEEGDRGVQSVLVEIDSVKEPRADHITATIQEGAGDPTVIQVIQLGDTAYFLAGEQWIPSPHEGFFLDELTVITPGIFQGNPDEIQNLEEVGSETINGRNTIHYRGDKNAIPYAQAGSDSFDAQEVGSAQIDLWIDQAENFIVKTQLIIDDDLQRDRPMHADIVYEYLDFNADITIDAPDAATVPSYEPPTAAEVDLTPILGFDLDLPDDTPILQYNNGRIASILTDFTLEDALAFFQSAMEANGYTLVSSSEVFPNEWVQIYTQGADTKNVTIFTNDSGGTTINLGGTAPAAAP